MNISYYTIDDLRQPPKRLFRKGCTIWHFDTVEAAISHYQALPATGEKSLGITDGFHVLELVKNRRLRVEGDGEDSEVRLLDWGEKH